MQCSFWVFWRLASAGETVALVAHDGVDALLDVAQHLGGTGSSATAGGTSPACARATWPAKVVSMLQIYLGLCQAVSLRSRPVYLGATGADLDDRPNDSR